MGSESTASDDFVSFRFRFFRFGLEAASLLLFDKMASMEVVNGTDGGWICCGIDWRGNTF